MAESKKVRVPAIPNPEPGGRIEIRETTDGWRMTVKPEGERARTQVYSSFAAATRAASEVQYAPGASPGAWIIDIDFGGLADE